MKVREYKVSERDLIDLIGNVDVSVLVDKIVEKDMKGTRKLMCKKNGKLILILFPVILLVSIVFFVYIIKNSRK